MNVTQVALCPTEASNAASRPALTPELLAASGARYSRSNEGLGPILARIDPNNLDKSVDGIFRMIDYGHQSIADMAPVALFMDGISLWLAYYIWTLCPTAGGQESSTRYVELSAEGLVSAEVAGIPRTDRMQWRKEMNAAFESYQNALGFWAEVAAQNPALLRIPASLQNDPSDKAQKAVKRMGRNYAFDRARYFLPVAARTNVMMVQSARAWVACLQNLMSHPLPEARALGELARTEMGLAAPRLLRHAQAQPTMEAGLKGEADDLRDLAQTNLPSDAVLRRYSTRFDAPPTAFLDVFLPVDTQRSIKSAGEAFARDLTHHENRYAYIGQTLRRTSVRFGWQAVAWAEIRDLNRHRTGTKYCPLVPVGFYHAEDELPSPSPAYYTLGEVGQRAAATGREKLQNGEPSYVYHLLLGTQFPFEHTTTADKFIYEAELRTGVGSHFRYARHLRDCLQLWYERFPQTRGLVQEGMAEPE